MKRGIPIAAKRTAAFVLLAAGTAARAQFKEIKDAPFPPSEAPQRIRTLLEKADPDNRNQTIATLLGWAAWYRDTLDTELISLWKGSGRANLTLVIHDLADSRVATEVVEFSWHLQRNATFRLDYASTLGDMMARYPESARPFLDDLLSGRPAPGLSPPETEAVCRILIDMPDIGTWRRSGLEILARFRPTAESLLRQDVNGRDREKMLQAHAWLQDLGWDGARGTGPRQVSRSSSAPPVPPAPSSSATSSPRPHVVSQPLAPDATTSVSAAAPGTYDGARSGTLESAGGPIPQNGEYIFRNLPPVKMRLEYDTKNWEASLEQGAGPPQKLVVRNKGNGPQKRCVVHWTAIP